MESKTARPGQRIFLQGFTYYFATQGCRSRAATIELVRPPRGGRIEQRREFRILSAKVDETGAQIRQPDGCEDAKKDSMSLYYTARPDFSGLDTLSIDVTFGDGSTVPYTFRITVPPGEPRRAPAVSEVPVPRAGDAGQAAPAARAIPAPASREAGRPAPAPATSCATRSAARSRNLRSRRRPRQARRRRPSPRRRARWRRRRAPGHRPRRSSETPRRWPAPAGLPHPNGSTPDWDLAAQVRQVTSRTK